jgi:hypothetical protein
VAVSGRASGADLAAELLGHTSSKITEQHYIEPDETVNPMLADILDAGTERLATLAGSDKPSLIRACANSHVCCSKSAPYSQTAGPTGASEERDGGRCDLQGAVTSHRLCAPG